MLSYSGWKGKGQVESPPPALMVESFTVAEHAAHDGNDIRRALGELGREMPHEVVNVRDLRKAMIKHGPVAPHVGEFHPVGTPLFSRRHFHHKPGSTVQA